MYDVHVLKEGYSYINENSELVANATCTLITGGTFNVLVDTLTPWHREELISLLKGHDLVPDQIDYVVCTTGAYVCVGNINLFTNAKLHIIGFDVANEDKHYLHPFHDGTPFEIDGSDLKVIPTPGHTPHSVAVKVHSKNGDIIVVAGDTFEMKEDLYNGLIWKAAGSDNVEKQEEARKILLCMADFIIPGHGPMFVVPEELKSEMQNRLNDLAW